MAFVVFEGLDGAGKSTLMTALIDHLTSKKVDVVLTREPGGTELGEDIRQMLLRRDRQAPTPKAELFLYQAARAQHVDLLIKPALKRGSWVVCDRFTASTLAFQSGGRNLNADLILATSRQATDDLKPDLWVLLDLPVTEAENRMRGRTLDRFEVEARDFHERVRNSYLQQAKEEPARWLVLDATKPVEKLREVLMSELHKRGLL